MNALALRSRLISRLVWVLKKTSHLQRRTIAQSLSRTMIQIPAIVKGFNVRKWGQLAGEAGTLLVADTWQSEDDGGQGGCRSALRMVFFSLHSDPISQSRASQL